jgi:hypothetical protein
MKTTNFTKKNIFLGQFSHPIFNFYEKTTNFAKKHYFSVSFHSFLAVFEFLDPFTNSNLISREKMKITKKQ